jgi:DHA2 family multidrug resistance protein
MSGNAPLTDSRRLLITIVVCLASFMQALDSTIANVALPFMQGSLNASQEQIAWVITSYVVATAVAISASVFVTERFGQRQVFVFSIIGFTLTSVLCGLAQSLPQIVLFRLMQGVSAACLMPLSQAMMISIWPPEKRGQAISMWGVGVMLAPVMGPTIGGYLTEMINWRWVFFINVPMGIICAFGLFMSVPDTPRRRDKRINGLGFAYLAVALGSLQLMLDRGPTLDWFGSNEIVVEGVIAALCFSLFIVDLFTSKNAIFDPVIFKDRSYVSGAIVSFFANAALLSMMVLWPNMLQTLLGFPIVTTGELMIPRGIGTMIGMFVVGRLVQPFGTRTTLLAGLLMSAFSSWLLSGLTLDASAERLMFLSFIQGIGIGFVFVPVSIMAFETLAPHFVTQATVLYSLLRNLGNSVGVSLVVALLSHVTIINHATLSQFVNPYNRAIEGLTGSITVSGGASVQSLAAVMEGEISRQANMIAYCNVYLIMAYVLLGMSVFLIVTGGSWRPGVRRTSAGPMVHEA